MAVRKRALKPDPQGRYRPYLGYRIDGKQQRVLVQRDVEFRCVRVDE